MLSVRSRLSAFARSASSAYQQDNGALLEGAAALEEVLTATRKPSAATSVSSAPAAAPPSRIAELEALVSQLRAETVQLAEAVARAEERAELERGFETEESDSGVEPLRQPIGLPWRLRSASSCCELLSCTPWCLASIGCVVTVQEATISLKSTFVRSVQLLRPMGDDTKADRTHGTGHHTLMPHRIPFRHRGTRAR